MNLPNKLTIVRICLVPVVVALYLCIPADAGIVNEATHLGIRNLLVLLVFAIARSQIILMGCWRASTIGSRRLASSRIRSRTRCLSIQC